MSKRAIFTVAVVVLTYFGCMALIISKEYLLLGVVLLVMNMGLLLVFWVFGFNHSNSHNHECRSCGFVWRHHDEDTLPGRLLNGCPDDSPHCCPCGEFQFQKSPYDLEPDFIGDGPLKYPKRWELKKSL